MPLSQYLPSAQFSLIVTSLMLAGGLVLAADYFTSPTEKEAESVAASNAPLYDTQGMDWKASLAAIQGESVLPKPFRADTLQDLRKAAETDNITGTVARTLLLNLAEAKSQGLGSDVPTQERIIADVAARATLTRGEPIYTEEDLTIVAGTPLNLKAYGNALILILRAHPKTSPQDTLLAISYALDGDRSQLTEFPVLAAQHRSLAQKLAATPVPEALVPIHLQVINNLSRVAELYPTFQAMLGDPLPGLSAITLYQSLVGETQRLLINIAQMFDENGILFTSDEPGAAWSLLLSLESDL